LWIGLGAVYFLSFWLFLWVASEKDRVIAKETEIRKSIDGQRKAADEAKLENERRKKAQVKVVATEQEKTQLAAARQLIQQKAFSWNKIIGDIEEYVPNKTRIMSIKVEEVAKDADQVMARVQVKAIGTTPTELTEMMTNLEKSAGLFVVGETGQAATTENGETPFTINLIYKPMRGNSQ